MVIDGFSDERWHEIIKGVDLTLHKGEVLGLIGELGRKSTLGLAAMGFTRSGCRLTSGRLCLTIDLMSASETAKQKLRGARIAYAQQSAAAAPTQLILCWSKR